MKKIIFSLLVMSQFAVAMDSVDISGLDKKSLLNALYQRAKPLGMGFLHYIPNEKLSDSDAEAILKGGYVDYLRGRVMKINLSGNSVNTRGYNRDNGPNAAEDVIEKLR